MRKKTTVLHTIYKSLLVIAMLQVPSVHVDAQYNIKKMMEEGRRNLDLGYYVVSMELFRRIVALKPNLYEPWFLMGKSKFHLEDYEGAIENCTTAISLNPFVPEVADLRGLSNIRIEQYENAANDYSLAIELRPDNREYWFNRAYCYYQLGKDSIALAQLNYIISRWHDFTQAKAMRREILSGRKPVMPSPKWRDKSEGIYGVGIDKWKLHK